MRAVIAKELRQGQALLLFGPLFIALVGVLYVYLSRAYVRNFSDQENVDTACAVLIGIGAAVSGLLALTGAFAADQERGTLPLLLSLPLSRARIWSAKLVASVIIALACVILILIPGALVVPQAVDQLKLPAYVWDLAIWWCFAAAVATFCSTFCERTLTALVNTILLGAALSVGVALLQFLGASLLGYDELLDMELWLLAAVPGLLLASFLTFSRGELLQSRRKLGLAFGAFLCSLLVIWLAVAGLTRWAVCYQRAAVKQIEVVAMENGARAIAIRTMASPVVYRRTIGGWTGGEEGYYRSNHAVVLDLKTGRELLVCPGESEAGVSPDGALAAVLPVVRAPLTYWGAHQGVHVYGDRRKLEIWDLADHRLLSRPLANLPTQSRWSWISPRLDWSPSGSWLAASRLWREEPAGPASQTLVVVQPDGSHRAEIPLAAMAWATLPWAWDPAAEGVYVFGVHGEIERYPVTGGAVKAVWDFVKGPVLTQERLLDRAARDTSLSVSPDGKWIAAAFLVREEAGEQAYVFSIYAVAADGSRAYLIYRDSYRSGYALDELKLTWAHHSSRLYFVPPWSAARRLPPTLCRWQAGSPAAAVIPLPAGAAPVQIAALDTGEMLVWSYLIGPLLLDASDHLRPLPHAPAVKTYSLVGLDAEGRAILQRAWGKPGLAALDLATGKLSVIYP
jgi:ABC-type transport system involved in multi-copper enzyme maturation permease subunit